MELGKRITKIFIALFLVGCVAGMAAPPLSAQVEIPEGSTIDQAVFSIYAWRITSQTVNVHRITADWGENSVTWNSFGASYDNGTVIGSFTTDSLGWRTVDVTALVQAWVNGVYPNHGILLQQGLTPYTTYPSSELINTLVRPKLEIWYTTPAGDSDYAIIQRPDVAQDGVADAYIWELHPDTNYNIEMLTTGNANGFEKMALLRFHFTVIPYSPGVGTPGYWKNHPEAWPVDEITIGGILYTKDEAIAIMNMEVAGDKTYNMFFHLVAAKLNVLIGNASSCIAETITAADAWMAAYGPVGSGVAAKSDAWDDGEPLKDMLDEYNNGELCAPERD